MKCNSCGYEHEEDYNHKGELVLIAGDEKFVRIDCFGKSFETDSEKDNDYITEYNHCYLYGCPKCNTVLFDYTCSY